MKRQRINIKNGDLTYGQRIELAKILSDNERNDIQRIQDTFRCLYDINIKPTLLRAYIAEYNDIVEGIKYWAEVESQTLHIEPTPEELAAGIEQYQKAVGDLATLHAIAKAYGQDPDCVYNWKYNKVFGILYNDIETTKYQRRYNQVISKRQ